MRKQKVDLKIGLWGAYSSGKSCYLASLSLAAVDTSTDLVITPNDSLVDGSTERFHNLREPLLDRRLPQDTPMTQPLALTFVKGRKKKHFLIQDPRGDDFIDEQGINSEFWGELASCDAIIYLYDPIREADLITGSSGSTWPTAPGEESTKSNFQYLIKGLDYVRQICDGDNWLKHGRLPHRLAVCVTKIDEQLVFDLLYSNKLLQPYAQDDGKLDDEVPGIDSPQDAATAFRLLSDNWVANALEAQFQPRHVSYFAISATGYFIQNRSIAIGDTCNVTKDKRLRSTASPVSVLEPLEWLLENA